MHGARTAGPFVMSSIVRLDDTGIPDLPHGAGPLGALPLSRLGLPKRGEFF